MPQAVLGVAFSFGIPMAFAAVRGGRAIGGDGSVAAAGAVIPPTSSYAGLVDAVPALAWWLLLGNLFWVLAYDTEYAMVDRDDDLRIGIHTSAITLGRFDVAAVMGFYAVFLGSWAWLGHQAGLGGLYLLGIAAAAAITAWHYTLIRGRTRDGCFRAFRLNHWVGFAVFAGVVAATWPPR
jgi:4-hydroxybenzoate polyprenyltransferase